MVLPLDFSFRPLYRSPSMNPDRLLDIPGTECLLPAPPGSDVSRAFTSDLLSDVLAHAADNSILITIQAHQNTVAVASLVGIRVILACSSRPVPSDMLVAARNNQIAVFRTPLDQFESSVAVHRLLSPAP